MRSQVNFRLHCSEIRECLKLDPDHKECFQLYKKVKKVNKLNGDAQEYINNKEYEECIVSAQKVSRRVLTLFPL